ncbi:MAG TPA: hypothetical protein VHO29_05865 [Marmoricola sp.]|nr:hypothetical protein [Marmoricola sp.]
MNMSKTARIVGFMGALGGSAALIGTAATSTGAYFTDSHDGVIRAGTGHVRVATSDTKLNFDNLLPGSYKTDRVAYTAQGTDSEDIWMVFPNDSGQAEALVGKPDDGRGGGLGRYGHLKVTSTGGAHFVSNNLSREGTTSGHTGPSCAVNSNGWGGSTQEATDTSDHGVPFCGPANAILLQSGMTNGQSGYVDVEFGFTKLLTGPQDAPTNKVAEYQIVATQHGVRPDNPNN